MLILVPENSFKKKIGKWVRYKDFVVANALDRHDGEMYQYGNTVTADELNPSPTLVMIATSDPDNKEAEIKRRRLNVYLDTWLNDEGVNIRIHYLTGLILKNYSATGEDTNVFIVLRKQIFYAYHEALERHINEEYGCDLATFLTHKMEKDVAKEILSRPKDKAYFKTIKKARKRIADAFQIKESENVALEDLDGIY